MDTFTIKTTKREMIVDITDDVRKCVEQNRIDDGICVVYIPHTTAGISINENADPSVKTDMTDTLKSLIPESSHYRHSEGNSDSHVKASLVGSSVTTIIENGTLCLGTWQGIYFCEFDGPRTRDVWVKIIRSA
jgi:secondary thiamine-phosphate synthase enzyme